MDVGSISCDIYVDISGLDCEASSSKLLEAVGVLEPGKVLMAVAKKGIMQFDVLAYCQQNNFELVDHGGDEQQFYFLIRK